MRSLGLMFGLFLALSGEAFAEPASACRPVGASELVEHFSGYTHRSKVTYDYRNYEAVLRKTVWEKGRSTRKYAPRPRPAVERSTGREIQGDNRPNVAGNTFPDRLEANRVFFHLLNDQNLSAISSLLQAMQQMPSKVPLSTMRRREQLAYWLNLHNLAVFDAIARNYHVAKVEKLNDQLSREKILCVDGIQLSLYDIRHVLVPRIWRDPRVIYGFYLGAVGGPNIRKTPYEGVTVFEQLEENAVEFVNALRGVRFDGNEALISPYYRWHDEILDNEQLLMAHLLQYAEGEVATRLPAADKVKFIDFDWFIADFFNGYPPRQIVVKGPFSGDPSRGLPVGLQELWEDQIDRNHLREGSVELEEYVGEDSSAESEQANDTPQ